MASRTIRGDGSPACSPEIIARRFPTSPNGHPKRRILTAIRLRASGPASYFDENERFFVS
jgi:hypothetical protein